MVCKRGCRVLASTRAQTTLFIILGILLLGGVTLYIVSTERLSLPEGQIEEQQEIPSQFNAVQVFVENCAAKVAEEGLVRIGQTGGYIEPRRYGIASDPAEPTEGRAVRFDPSNEDTAIAYWWHFKSNNLCTKNCQCGSERPNLRKNQGEPSIEGQLGRYINENLGNCLQGFRSLKQDGFVVQELGPATSNVIVAGDGVSVILNYPISVVLENSEISMKQFTASVNVPIARLYEFASKITNTEIKYPFLERWTLEQVTAFGLGPDAEALPPTAASVFDPSKKPEYWQKSDAKNLMQFSILPYYTQFLQVWRTSNYDERGGYYQKATVPVNETYADLKVTFEYLSWWPIYFDIKGRGVRGDFIGPETAGITGLFSWLGLQRYNFYYDVSYPVRIDIYDPAALNNRGYHFMFNLESNVRGNKPLNCTGTGLPATLPPTGTLLCDPRLFCANVSIATSSGNLSQDAEIAYGHEGEACSVGRISAGKVSLPQCVGSGCTLTVSGHEVFSSPQSLSVRCDLPENHAMCRQKNVVCNNGKVSVSVEPYRAKNIAVMKKRNIKSGGTWNFDASPAPLLKNEYAVVSIQKIKEAEAEPDLFATVIYYGNESSVEVLPGLVPGKYTVSIELYYGLPDAQGRTYVEFKDKIVAGQKVHIDPLTGVFNEGSTTLELVLSQADLDRAQQIIFYAVSSPDSASFDSLDVEDISQVGKSEILAAQFRASIEPTYR
ncbi:hypothetical protein HYV81_01305 [Candidatus Woesearchaeota archaeon]|nr:hypothetical protein [Candidatus Woesearchaeota archaeon]